MRIISGIYKGRKLKFPKSIKTRPLRDLVKESIFNLIENSNKFKFEMHKAKILDLFSGSGSFGLECISRGAKKVIFIENNHEALKVLKKNISELKSEMQTNVVNMDCFDFFDSKNDFKEKFDIIFLDPPFREIKLNNLIDQIKNRNLLNKNGVIITHRHKKDNLDLSDKLNIIDERSYGISKIIMGI